jgi:trimethylamine--corrinoid protein Co-methyltransferase
MRVNYQTNTSTQFRILSDDQCEELYSAALQVLQHTGFEVHSKDALDLLSDNGASVKGNRAYIPASMVQKVLDAAPKGFFVYGHQGDRSKSLDIRPNHVHYGLGAGCVSFQDPRTSKRREYRREDAATVARVADALPHIDFVQSLGTIGNIPQNLTDVYEFAEMIVNTSKPLVTYVHSMEILRVVHKIAVTAAGGEEEFIRRPNYLVLGSPASPLFEEPFAVERLFYCARHHIPYISTSAVTCGATSPVTMAGTLVQVMAEELAELVIEQLAVPGSPFLLGGVHSVMDMSTGILAYGAPEMSMLLAAQTEIARYLGLPYYSTAGCSDSKLVDEQAALEGAISILMAGLSGANMIHDVGYIEFGSTGSLQQTVMMDEVIGMVKHILAGIQVTPESMALDVIDRVGPGGQYLTDDHTIKHFKTEFWFPTLLDRKPWQAWEAAGAKSLGKRVQEKLNRIMDTHTCAPLKESTRETIDTILAEAEAKAGRA